MIAPNKDKEEGKGKRKSEGSVPKMAKVVEDVLRQNKIGSGNTLSLQVPTMVPRRSDFSNSSIAAELTEKDRDMIDQPKENLFTTKISIDNQKRPSHNISNDVQDILRRQSTNEKIISFLNAQKDPQMPPLSKYEPNKQERNYYNELESRFGGSSNQLSNKSQRYLESEREKELLAKLQDLKKDNNIKREKIRDLTSQVNKLTDSLNARRHNLNSIRVEYER